MYDNQAHKDWRNQVFVNLKYLKVLTSNVLPESPLEKYCEEKISKYIRPFLYVCLFSIYGATPEGR